VLYIEDHPVNLKLMQGVFALWPHMHLESVSTSTAGLERIRSGQLDLLLIDGNVIDLDGADVLRQIRSDPRSENLPVMVISSDARPARAVELLTLGANEYLVKPFDIDHLGYLMTCLVRPEDRPTPPSRSPHDPGTPPPPRDRRESDRGNRRPVT
jgi:CheY-like chemotaxis protein